MKKTTWIAGLFLMFMLVMTACGAEKETAAPEAAEAGTQAAGSQAEKPAGNNTDEEAAEAGTRVIQYLDQEYKVPSEVERIVITGALEAMEDAIVLEVNPVGAITVSGEFPAMFESITQDAQSVGEKAEPNFETILSLKPDVILGTSKFKPEIMEQLNKIATTIPYSHISTNWESNLKLLGELTGKEKEAEEKIAQYKADLETARDQMGDTVKNAKVVAVRIRGGELYVYPEAVFFNPVLYEELGLPVPEEVKAAKAQEMISKEKFAEMNPDYLFVQFSEDENADAPQALEDFQNDPIIKNVNAFKNGKVFVNVVDPLAQGGTSYSKIEFLKAAVSSLSQ